MQNISLIIFEFLQYFDYSDLNILKFSLMPCLMCLPDVFTLPIATEEHQTKDVRNSSDGAAIQIRIHCLLQCRQG